ncbi:DNA polymerase III subunit gamma/tau [Trinickia dabaoshanensis]|uniref:DNA-directed DNA polymerase n=1 Tax=Trinickia dabaoshanensis TaxID=564714 RepID=A0A2N7VL87_9BURK|nr:DNA polymerase III subunit gamma/tau [Trinickia dabaoshanensis]PMS17924.1 DNA polymerase III subunit gamma/tau [Trinickia dabaoshanensis]
MTYQVLARKWRPRDFASLVGQEHVVRALTHALDGARLHHAYLFTGTRGVGKTTLSRIFAKALNCETGITAKPCGVCRACREIDEGRFVDYVEMDAASNRGVDEMAALLERAVYAPVDARFKVYMIDEVHMLTNHAFNAMLKTLEEPPPHIKFILATTDPQKIPVTVLSRCLQFNLKQMPAGHIVGHLEKILAAEQIVFEPQALRLLARAAEGSMRDALSLTDQAIAYSANQVSEEAVRGMLGALDQSYLIRLLDAIAAGDGPLVLSIADEMALRSLSFSTALQDLASLLHRVAWAQFAPASVLDEWPDANDLRRFAQALTPEQVQLYYQIATLGRAELGLAPDEYAGFTMTLLRMLAFEPALPPGSGPAGPAPKRGGAPAGAAGARGAAVVAQASRGAAQSVAAPQSAAASQSAASARSASRETPVDTPAPRAAEPPMQVASADAGEGGRVPDASADGAPQTAVSSASDASDASGMNGERAAMSVADENRASPLATGETPTTQTQHAPARATPAAPDSAPSVPRADAPGEPVAQASVAQPQAVPDESFAEPPVESRARMGGASAALDVLRNAGMRVSTDRNRAAAKPAAAAPVKAPAPRAPVVVPTPRPRTPERNSAPAPWDDMPPLDDYPPPSSEDDYFAGPPDDGFVPVFGAGPDDVRLDTRFDSPAVPSTPAVDLSKLPAPIALDAVGFAGDWPALACSLGLTGVAHQLAFNSELTELDGLTLALSVPVPQYADAAQVAKLKAALAEKLGTVVEVRVVVGPARRTAAVLDAAARAERQREAEREIGADPFVQSLIREFGASIVPGSIKPVSPDTEAGAGAR